jgi:hypothetical protein
LKPSVLPPNVLKLTGAALEAVAEARFKRRTPRGGRQAQDVSRRRPVQRVRRPPRYEKRTFLECPSGVHTRRSEHGLATVVARLVTLNRTRGNVLHPEHMRSQGTGDNRSKLPWLAPRLLTGAATPAAPASRSRRAGGSRRCEPRPPRPAVPARKHPVARASNQSVFLAYFRPANGKLLTLPEAMSFGPSRKNQNTSAFCAVALFCGLSSSLRSASPLRSPAGGPW